MKRILHALALLATLAYLAVCLALYALQRSLIYIPQPRAVTAAPSTMRLPVAGADLVVTVRPRAGPKALIYFGGNAEDVSRALKDFDAWFPGHALYLLHYRGYGGSSGEPTEQALHEDAVALYRKVQAEHPDVSVIGRSLGTGVAVRLASEVPVSHLVLVTPFDSLADPAAEEYPYVPVRWLLRDRYDSGRYAARITCPTTILRAGDDQRISRASTERLYRRFAPGVASMVVFPNAGHHTITTAAAYRTTLQSAL